MSDAGEQMYDQGIVPPSTEEVRVAAILDTERPPKPADRVEMFARLAELESSWERRLANQVTVIEHLSTSRQGLLAFAAHVRNEVVTELRHWSAELKQVGQADAAERIYQYSVELRARADAAG